jgi:SPOR domain
LPDGAEPPRRGRDELLLELGALVYELHRRGKRAPELLQEKAAELDALGEPAHGARPGSCPDCGADTAPGQLVCTDCGKPLALGRRRALPVAALAALAAVVVLGAGAAGFALSEITSDEDGGGPAAAGLGEQRDTPAPAASAGEPQDPTRATAPQEPGPGASRDLLLDWPDGLTAHTVVLVSSSDRPAALRLARQAARSGIETGMLRSDDYNLGTGLWIVFAGRFDSPEGAARQASDLAERFPGAYPQLVRPAG